MLDYFKLKYYRHKLFVLYSKLYSDHCPKKCKNRRNFNHSKIPDVEILALFFLQIRLKMHSQREFLGVC